MPVLHRVVSVLVEREREGDYRERKVAVYNFSLFRCIIFAAWHVFTIGMLHSIYNIIYFYYYFIIMLP